MYIVEIPFHCCIIAYINIPQFLCLMDTWTPANFVTDKQYLCEQCNEYLLLQMEGFSKNGIGRCEECMCSTLLM